MRLLAFTLLIATGCATPSNLKSPQMGRTLPPTRLDNFVLVDCQEFPIAGVLGCTYVGWRDDKLCASIVESKKEGEWKVIWSTCDTLKVQVLVPEGVEIPEDSKTKSDGETL